MKTRLSAATRRAFTLIELLVAMTITTILVLVIMTMTNQGVEVYKDARNEVDTSSRARVALNAISNDFQAMILGRGEDNYEWFFAKSDDTASRDRADSSRRGKSRRTGKDGFPHTTQLVFFASTFDRNPSVSSNAELRSNYRTAKAHNIDTQGDVNAVGYRLLYRDQILNLGVDGRGAKGTNTFPLFSLYRQTITPRDAYTRLMGQTNLEAAYRSFEKKEQDNFLCENILDMNLVFNIEHCREDVDIKTGRANAEVMAVSIISARGKNQDVSVTSRNIIVNGEKLHSAKIISINASVTVVTEEGMHIIDQVRRGRRALPKLSDFFNKYTRTYSALVSPSNFN